MIQELVDEFEAKTDEIAAAIAAEVGPMRYSSIGPDALVVLVFSRLTPPAAGERAFDMDRLTIIDHGDYQGTMVYVLTTDGYQPFKYWATAYGYGSCSGCDALEAIGNDIPELVGEARSLVQAVREIT